MSFPSGSEMPVHHVTCLGCRKPLALKTYWRQPRCRSCRRKGQKGREATRLRELRQQARRYRILLHLTGYTDAQFDELRAEIGRSLLAYRDQPETREARIDIRIERRSRKRALEACA